MTTFAGLINKLRDRACIALIISSLLYAFSLSAQANTQQRQMPTGPTFAPANYYVTLGLHFNEFKDVDLILAESDSINYETREDTGFNPPYFNKSAHTYGMAMSFGWYLNETFKTEWRFGKGIRSDTIKEVYEINFDHWVNWYIGAQKPVTEFLKAYLLVGVSKYKADVKRSEIGRFKTFGPNQAEEFVYVQPSPFRNQPGLFGTHYSMSWMLGADIHLKDQWFLTVEYGRLLKDTNTGIEVHQLNTHLKYEF